MEYIEGGVTAAKGFKASSAAAGIKYQGRTDMAMIYSEVPCLAACSICGHVAGKRTYFRLRKHARCRMACTGILHDRYWLLRRLYLPDAKRHSLIKKDCDPDPEQKAPHPTAVFF